MIPTTLRTVLAILAALAVAGAAFAVPYDREPTVADRAPSAAGATP